LRAVFDLSDSGRDRGYTFEPGLSVGWRPWAKTSVGVGLTAFFGDRRINQLFYGVDPQFAGTAGRTAFDAQAGLIATRLSLSMSTAVSRDMYFGSYLRFDTVRGAANEDSPLVRKTEGLTAGVGLSWTLFRSERPAED
jgi:outer membrane scaffolding protein for murein synthesis (MipA/OmpV family)